MLEIVELFSTLIIDSKVESKLRLLVKTINLVCQLKRKEYSKLVAELTLLEDIKVNSWGQCEFGSQNKMHQVLP